MIVVEKFSAKFEVKFVAKLRNTILDMFRLDLEVFIVVEPVFHGVWNYEYGAQR